MNSAGVRIVHINLSAPLRAVDPEPSGRPVLLIFWAHGLPLGRCEVAADAMPISTDALAALAAREVAAAVGARLFAPAFEPALPGEDEPDEDEVDSVPVIACERPLAALRRVQDRFAGSAGSARVSVVVCTRDRPGPLARCLDALARLRDRPHELVVVDNAPSSDATQRLAAARPEVRYVLEPRAGLAVARNTGVRATTGDVIAFTDDDAVVHPDWLARLVPPFADPRVMSVTGTVLPAVLATEAERLAEARMWSFNRELRPRTFTAAYFARVRARGVPVWYVGAGANMAIRRTAFTHVGLFDERLGPGTSGCGEDSELWYRLLAAGWHCAYEPAAVVSHYHRPEVAALAAQWHAYMRGHVATLFVQFARHRHWGNIRRLLLQLPLHHLLWFRDVVRREPAERRVWWAALTGSVAGVAYYTRHRRRPGAPPPAHR